MSSLTQVKLQIKPSVRKKDAKPPSDAVKSKAAVVDKNNDPSLKVSVKRADSSKSVTASNTDNDGSPGISKRIAAVADSNETKVGKLGIAEDDKKHVQSGRGDIKKADSVKIVTAAKTNNASNICISVKSVAQTNISEKTFGTYKNDKSNDGSLKVDIKRANTVNNKNNDGSLKVDIKRNDSTKGTTAKVNVKSASTPGSEKGNTAGKAETTKDGKNNDGSLKINIKRIDSANSKKSVTTAKTSNERSPIKSATLANVNEATVGKIGSAISSKNVKDDKEETDSKELKEENSSTSLNNTKAVIKAKTITNVLKKDETKREVMTMVTGKDTVGDNGVVEEKITNIEREKMMSLELQKQLKESVFAKEKDAKLSMEQEKKMDFDSETASMISERITPKPSLVDLDKIEEKDPGFEPGNMIDELQKYLKKRFGPLLANTVDSDVKTKVKVEKTTQLPVEKVVTESDKPAAGATAASTAVKPPIPGAVSILPHPIIFKTSIKKDPGSKLQDDLVKELSSVLRKREGGDVEKETGKEMSESSEHVRDESKIPKRRISAKGNKVLGNKALLASLESQLNRTLHKHKVFQRQRLKVLGLETVEVGSENNQTANTEAQSGESKETVERQNETEQGKSEPIPEPWSEAEFTHKAQLSPVDVKVKPKTTATSAAKDKRAETPSDPEKSNEDASNELTMSPSDIDKLFVYAIEHAEGWSEGIVCSVEERKETKDSSGEPRKYLTCINIVAEKAVDDEGNYRL